MQADILHLYEIGARERAAWQALSENARSPNPFFEPGFVAIAARAMRADDIAMLVVREGTEWRAAVPVRSVRRWRGVPGRSVAGWRHSYCYLGTPLVAAEDPEAVLAALIEKGVHAGGCLALDWIDADGPLVEPLTSAFRSRSRSVEIETFERAALRRRPDNAYLERTVSSRHRKELRRTLRLLGNQLGGLSVNDRAGETDAYAKFLELERSGWKGRAGTAMASRPESALFVELCELWAGAGRLELLSLDGDNRTAAMKCNVIAGEVTFCFKIAFDETLGRYSPGIHLEVANIDHFHAGVSAWSDSCADSQNQMVNRLWPDRRRLCSVVACARGATGALTYAKWLGAARGLPAQREIRSRIRRYASRD